MIFDRRQLLVAGAALAVSPRAALAAPRELDVAYFNAKVWTGLPRLPASDAIGIVGDRIAAMGAGPVQAATGKRTQLVDLKGAFVMPGFIDGHTHFLRASFMLSRPTLKNARSPADFTRMIGEAARAMGPSQWIQGGNWDNELWGGELPTRAWIDAVTPDTPVAVTRYDLHIMLLNSLAMKLAGIDRDTPDPPGGLIMRDARGEPTGIIKDRAKLLVERAIPAPSPADVDAAIAKGIAHGLSHGITQVHVTELDWVTQDALRRIRRRGEPGMRFYSFVPLADWARLAALVRAEGRGDDWVRWGGVKGLVDGSLGSRTALFHEHYDDAPDTRGITVTPRRNLEAWIGGADAAGLQVTVHAIGDEANDILLDVFAAVERKNGKRDRRFRIEHAQHLTGRAIKRIAAQNIVASVQPYHAIDDGRWAVRRIGDARLEGTYAFGSLMAAGARVCFGSDWPVAPLDARIGIQAAVLRQTLDGKNPTGWLPKEKVTVEQALHAYTTAGAYAGFQDDRLGRLAPGYLADFCVLGADPRTVKPAAIAQTPVIKTIVGGRERYSV